MSERTTDTTATVEEDGVRVEKSFTGDRFPVPAVTYTLSSTREEPVRVRIVDRIPDSFPMDRIGFHPEYESENWTAYNDNRVEFERVIDPEETVETVFGIRDDDPDGDGFMETPVVEHVPVGEEIADVLGAGDTDAVREVLSGDRATLPGMADGPETADSPADGTVSESASDGPTTEDASGGAAAESPDNAEPTAERDARSADSEAGRPDEDDEAVEGDETADETSRSAEPAAAEGEFAAALAAEIRSGAADEADVATIGAALDTSVPRSVDVRIARLQSSVADIEAYADALSEFIDDEGTARDVLDEIDERVEAVESETDALDEAVDAVEETVSGVETDVDDVEADVETLFGETDAATATAESATERADRAHDRIDGVESTLDRFDEEFDDMRDDLAKLDSRLTDAEDRLDEDLDDIRAELDAVDDHLGELDGFRTRLNEAFGP